MPPKGGPKPPRLPPPVHILAQHVKGEDGEVRAAISLMAPRPKRQLEPTEPTPKTGMHIKAVPKHSQRHRPEETEERSAAQAAEPAAAGEAERAAEAVEAQRAADAEADEAERAAVAAEQRAAEAEMRAAEAEQRAARAEADALLAGQIPRTPPTAS